MVTCSPVGSSSRYNGRTRTAGPLAMVTAKNSMTTATSNAMQSIAPEKTSNITVDATFDPTAVLKNLTSVDFLKSVLASYKDTSLRFAGTVSAQHSGVSVKNIPVDYTTKVGDLF